MLEKYHLKSLDGIRGIACTLVIISHYLIQINYKEYYGHQIGSLGVMIFFSLSGFLMMHVTRKIDPTINNIKIFFFKRISRIIPLFYSSLIIIFLYQNILRYMGLNEKLLAFNELISFKEVILNALLIKGDVVFWSIGPEIVFYAIFPLIWYFGRFSISKSFFISVSIFLIFRSTNFFVYWPLNFTRISFVSQYFLFGCVSYFFFDPEKHNKKEHKNILFYISFISIVSFSPVIGYILTGSDLFPNEFVKMYVVQKYFFFFIPFFIVSCANSSVANYILGNKLFCFLGKISFSMYIWHYIFIRILSDFIIYNNINYFLFFVFIIMPLCSFFSYLSYKFIETPQANFLNRIILPYLIRN